MLPVYINISLCSLRALWLYFLSIFHAFFEQHQPSLTAYTTAPMRVLPGEEMIFRVGHQSKHIPLRVADASNIGDRSIRVVWIGSACRRAIWQDIDQGNLITSSQGCQA